MRSPAKPFRLPSYIEAVALVESEYPSPTLRQRRRCNPHMLKYIDEFAIEDSGSDSL